MVWNVNQNPKILEKSCKLFNHRWHIWHHLNLASCCQLATTCLTLLAQTNWKLPNEWLWSWSPQKWLKEDSAQVSVANSKQRWKYRRKKTHSLQKMVSQGLLAMHFDSEQVWTTAFCALTVTGTTLSSYVTLWAQIPNQYENWWLWSSRISMPLTTLTKITRTASFLTMKRTSSDKRGSAYQVVGLSVAIMTFDMTLFINRFCSCN